jgi:hypothetical protein
MSLVMKIYRLHPEYDQALNNLGNILKVSSLRLKIQGGGRDGCRWHGMSGPGGYSFEFLYTHGAILM